MNKKYILEQINRSRAITLDENNLHKMDDDNYWILHNEGHIKLLDEFENIIKSLENIDKKKLKKFLKEKIKKCKEVIHKLDEKYNFFENDEEMNQEDKYLYSSSDGIDCEANAMIRMLNGKYYSKDSYEPTNWNELFNFKEENKE